MHDHAAEAVKLLGDKTVQELENDRVLQLALIRLVEVVGEAASQIPVDFRDLHPNLPWREASSMRNLLIHGYDIIRIDILIKTIQVDMVDLVHQLKAIIRTDAGD